MKLIKPSWEILEQKPGLEGIYQQIETAGRTCYKSTRPEGKTAKDFVDMLIKNKHWAMLEHCTVYLQFKGSPSNNPLHKYLSNPYSKVNVIQDTFSIDMGDPDFYDKVKAYERKRKWAGDTYYVTTNYRVLVENGWLEDLEYLCEPTEYHEKRVTVRFTSNIHFYKDITRHRRMSFAIESTRYCNYSKEKFSSELTFIAPIWSNLREGTISYFRNGKPMLDSLGYTDDGTTIKDNYSEAETDFVYAMQIAENMYINSILHGWQAQQAAEILPQATKADIIMTGFVMDWNYVFDLRARGTTGAPHPEVKRLIEPLMNEFAKRNLITLN